MKFIEFPKNPQRKKNNLDHIVFSTRVRLARNLEGLSFPLLMTEKQKSELDARLSEEVIRVFKDASLENIDRMARDLVMIYLSTHVITNEFLKIGRAFTYDPSGDWVMLFNEDDHIRIHSIETGYNPRQIFHRLSSVVNDIEKNVDFAFDEHYGYLTSSILNVGTGLRVSFLCNLFGLAATKKIEQFIETANKIGYSVVNIAENSDSGLYTIYNIYSLGISEEELISEFDHFMQRVGKLEEEARKEYFGKQEELEIAYEEILDISIHEQMDRNTLLYYVSLIDAMNRKQITLRDIDGFRGLVTSSQDDYLLYKENVDISLLDSVRVNMLKSFSGGIKYKTSRV